MNTTLQFKDFGFKLAVINELMYNQDILQPKIDAYTFIEKQRNLTASDAYDVIEEEGYDIIPEIKEYFENLEITESMVHEITELSSDGGDDIYLQIIPFWDGEDNVYDVTSAEDVKLLPNLKRATLLFEYPGEQLVKEFKELGVELESI
ncbi:DUF6892 domain-containing protein [Aquimarina algicola]|uniref:DUF6892 domain-containing protein n=1 Tax=Aquimarina algicola TaxID=2589995 RepID=A0A504J2X4_9FLAO|nr:hypothetical protein [Aquimarina algicola]TPN82975.1 hypothetical protein FHK87_21350 [Aquimarina algicola]